MPCNALSDKVTKVSQAQVRSEEGSNGLKKFITYEMELPHCLYPEILKEGDVWAVTERCSCNN